MHIFNVTTIKNLETIELSAAQHIKLHGYEKYTVICPQADVLNFKSRLAEIPKIEIISEDGILSFYNFSKICEESTKKYDRPNLNHKRLSWYYQQVLKLAYAIECQADFILMWDADSIPLSKINFFHEKHSLNYGSMIEFNNDYFETIREIFDFINPDMAFTIQFFTLTSIEKENLVKILTKYREKKENESTAEWVAIILTSAVAAKNVDLERFDQSYISEQELVGLTNMKLSRTPQKAIKHFRPGRFWKMTGIRLFILKTLCYKYITLERNNEFNKKYIEMIYFWSFLAYDIFRTLMKKLHHGRSKVL